MTARAWQYGVIEHEGIRGGALIVYRVKGPTAPNELIVLFHPKERWDRVLAMQIAAHFTTGDFEPPEHEDMRVIELRGMGPICTAINSETADYLTDLFARGELRPLHSKVRR